MDVVLAGVRLPRGRRGRAEARRERVDRGGETPAHRRRTGGAPPIGAAEHAVPAAHAAPQCLAEHLAQITVVAVLVCRAEVLIARRVVERQRDLRVEVAELGVEDDVHEARVPLVHERHRGAVVVAPVAVAVAAMGTGAHPVAQETDHLAEPAITGGEGQRVRQYRLSS